jgi:hypothetical protein
MSQIQVRALDASWDTLRGAGMSNFLTDLNAVAQIIRSRLLFLQGEWFESLTDGTPIFQQLLGVPTTVQAVTLMLHQRILGTPYVTGIVSLSVSYAPAGRNFAFAATIQTQFGVVSLTNQG